MLPTSSRWLTPLLVLLLTHAVVLADGPRAFAGSRADGAPVVFVANDYGFTGPDRIPSGVTTLQIVNKGQDLHHIQLLRLLQGKTAEDFRAALKAEPGRLPQWIAFVGGPNAVSPGGEARATMSLGEGEYLLICLIPNKEGVPHMALGMQKPLSVKGVHSTLVSEPKAGLTITQADFGFALSQPVTAGPHTIQVVNHGTQPHEVVLVRLAPGATAKQFAVAAEGSLSGPPPGKPMGGVVGLETGAHGFFTARFEPGRYGLICFFPDPATGKPHFVQGMTSEFTVE
ncbi:MAG: hypothetical protein H8K10_02850 [Nitrospira sp.]|nr:hypothetical protein [Nitrospira sp.]